MSQYAPAPRGQQVPAVSVENQIMQMKTEFARAIALSARDLARALDL